MAKTKEQQAQSASPAPASASMPGEARSPDADLSLEGGQLPASAEGLNEAAPQTLPEAPEPELLALSALADNLRIPGWQSAALHTMMAWEPGKKVSAAEYKAGLARLKTRRIGG